MKNPEPNKESQIGFHFFHLGFGPGLFLDHKFDTVTYNIYSEDKLNVSVTYNRDTSPD